ncbi:GNAT family N-acetyltransferase [Octadecabacter sp. G9-8]|uniref:GNAT family N-acetyltransferase n=1 Tax=Octadecabacter dasysiphoniae TaxID=2909341 RepID=A0ABS9D2D9_9RHOB|nr:GNAT family N-acetyltransferase [Octadecabacter dasysiphoniae]MCF2872805.1 GNAT family N-acetyltransferase [Octadecabacter dasysiphoniae]
MLKTQRLILRGPRADDLDDMFALFSDPRVMRYWSTPVHKNRDVTADMLKWRIKNWPDWPHYFQIEHEGRVVGSAGNHRSTEIGFMLSPDHWRKGIITEAMSAIIPHLWDTTDHDELTADADPLNAASIGLLTSLGFVETHRAKKTFFINGVWSDSVYFSLPRPLQVPAK